ncbi:MAG: aminotransferase class V-fold PLP-dependent enzyme, partial [Lachnospiraceae bacterium]|nr:aminotransferase class V-fold PLP-dependent enzyme [Lachnospiraceae bacterium]
EVNMERLQADVICFTGHKSLFGPQGTGGLCVREGVELPPMLSGGSGSHSYDHRQPSRMPDRLEAGTLNGHGLAGLKAGIEFVQRTGLEQIRAREQKLVRRFCRGLQDIREIRIYGDVWSKYHTGIVALNLGDHDSARVSDELAVRFGIATRPGAHCAPLMHQALGTERQGAVRFSFSWFNTEDEIDAGIRALRQLAEE